MQQAPIASRLAGAILLLSFCVRCVADDSVADDPLRLGVAGHAFDHLGSMGEQAEAAAASGATIIYATGLGGAGYCGLPAEDELRVQRERAAQYTRQAKEKGDRKSTRLNSSHRT